MELPASLRELAAWDEGPVATVPNPLLPGKDLPLFDCSVSQQIAAVRLFMQSVSTGIGFAIARTSEFALAACLPGVPPRVINKLYKLQRQDLSEDSAWHRAWRILELPDLQSADGKVVLKESAKKKTSRKASRKKTSRRSSPTKPS